MPRARFFDRGHLRLRRAAGLIETSSLDHTIRRWPACSNTFDNTEVAAMDLGGEADPGAGPSAAFPHRS